MKADRVILVLVLMMGCYVLGAYVSKSNIPPEPNAVEFNNVVMHPRGTPCIYDSSVVHYCGKGEKVVIMKDFKIKTVIDDSIDVIICNHFKGE